MDDRSIINLFFDRSESAINELKDKYGALCGALRNGTEITVVAEGQLYDKYFNDGFYYTIDAYTDEYIILNGYSDIYIISTGDAVPFTER